MARVRTGWKQKLQQDVVPSSFLSTQKDIEIILSRLFMENNIYSQYLKRLLVINSPDCLDNTTNSVYQKEVKSKSVAALKKEGFINIVPRMKLLEHPEQKSIIFISFDNYEQNVTNGYWRDCDVIIEILCNFENWDLGEFRLRPYLIAGYIDTLLHDAPLTGIGKLQLVAATQLILNDEFGGLSLVYRTIHGRDDILPFPEEDEDEDEE